VAVRLSGSTALRIDGATPSPIVSDGLAVIVVIPISVVYEINARFARAAQERVGSNVSERSDHPIRFLIPSISCWS